MFGVDARLLLRTSERAFVHFRLKNYDKRWPISPRPSNCAGRLLNADVDPAGRGASALTRVSARVILRLAADKASC